MTPVQAQAFVWYALKSLTEDQHVGAQLALVHSDRKAADMVHDAGFELYDELTREQIERMGRVFDRVCAPLRAEEAERLRRRRAKVITLHPPGTVLPRRD